MQRYIIITICLLLALAACGKKQQTSKNMEEILSEKGIPVRIAEVQSRDFVQELKFNAPLNGIEESMAKSMLSETILSVNARVGDVVSKGQVIITFPQTTPAAQYEQATSAFEATRQSYERMQRLFKDGAVSRQDLDNVETAFKVSKANLDASRKMIQITAPISGTITNMLVSAADHVNPGQDLFTVSNTSRFKATVWVTDTDISKIKKNAPAVAVWNDQSIKGKVSQIGLALDTQNKAFKVEIEFPNSNRAIKPGVTAEIKIQVFNQARTIVVERNQIFSEGDQKFVWVENGGQAHKREVTLGKDNGIEFEVLSGLEPGEKLIYEGQNMLSDKAKLRIIEGAK